jgi:phosphopentomutase
MRCGRLTRRVRTPHRTAVARLANDIEGYGSALEQFDAWLPQFERALTEGDLAILSADHGCDPTAPGTDHTREFVPLLAVPRARATVNLGDRKTLSDIGQTVAANFGAST